MFFTSGEIRADRRYSYAVECFAERDFLAARDYLSEAFEFSPHWQPALALYAKVLMALNEDSAPTLSTLISLDKNDIFGGRLMLASLKGETAQMSDTYIASLFDEYAPKFETALVQNLAYQVPEYLFQALQGKQFDRVLDVGCGTGLMAEKLGGTYETIDGVDLSSKMVEIAKPKNIYSSLHVDDMIGFMEVNKGYDLIIAADVLVYVGNLTVFIDTAKSALINNGTLAFTVQTFEGEGFKLGEDMRYAHSEGYIRSVLSSHFTIKTLKSIIPRLDGGKPINGLLIIAELP